MDIESILKIGNVESVYYPNGIKKPKYRTPEEKVKYCRRLMGKTLDPVSQTLKPIYEFGCGRVDPNNPPVCPSCVERRHATRRAMFLDRIDAALSSGETLYTRYTSTKHEMDLVRQNAYRAGISYLSFPLSASDDTRFVVLNGQVKGSSVTPNREIKDIVYEAATLFGVGRVSGKLGQSNEPPIDNDFVVPNVLYLYDDGVITPDVLGKIEAQAIYATSNMPIETREDIAALIEKRMSFMIGRIKGLDDTAVLVHLEMEKRVNFDEIKRGIYLRRISEHGESRMVEPETREAMIGIEEDMVSGDLDELEPEDEFVAMGIWR